MEEEIEEIEQAEGANFSTACDHEYVFDEYNGNLLSVVCIKCPHGAQYDRDKFELKKGVICPIK